MAVVKVNGKIYQGIVGVSFVDAGNIQGKKVLTLIDSVGQTIMLHVPERKTRIEVNGNVRQAKISNCANICGTITSAYIGNCLSVQGHIKGFKSNRGSIDVSRQFSYANNLRDSISMANQHDKSKFQVIHIDGNLTTFIVSATSICLIPVITGSIESLQVGNCAYVKGTVIFCEVGNIITCTMGLKLSNSRSSRKERANYEQFNKDIDEIFKGVFDRKDS